MNRATSQEREGGRMVTIWMKSIRASINACIFSMDFFDSMHPVAKNLALWNERSREDGHTTGQFIAALPVLPSKLSSVSVDSFIADSLFKMSSPITSSIVHAIEGRHASIERRRRAVPIVGRRTKEHLCRHPPKFVPLPLCFPAKSTTFTAKVPAAKRVVCRSYEYVVVEGEE